MSSPSLRTTAKSDAAPLLRRQMRQPHVPVPCPPHTGLPRRVRCPTEYGGALDCLVASGVCLAPAGGVRRQAVRAPAARLVVRRRPMFRARRRCVKCRLLQRSSRSRSRRPLPDRAASRSRGACATGRAATDSQVVLSLRLTEEEVTRWCSTPRVHRRSGAAAEILGGLPALRYAVPRSSPRRLELRAACERGTTPATTPRSRASRASSPLADAAARKPQRDAAARGGAGLVRVRRHDVLREST